MTITELNNARDPAMEVIKPTSTSILSPTALIKIYKLKDIIRNLLDELDAVKAESKMNEESLKGVIKRLEYNAKNEYEI